MTTFNVRTATMQQLVAFFNTNTGGNPVKKFADRPTAEKRVQRLVDEMKAEAMAEELGIKNAKAEAAFVAEKLAAGVNGTAAAADLIGKTNQPETEEFIPSYNHRVCPKCGSVEIYNGRTHGGLVVDEDTIAGCHVCDWIQDDRKRNMTKTSKPSTSTGKARPAMRASLKLDRRVRCVNTGEVFDNPLRIRRQHPEWLTCSQHNTLTARLYAAAKQGYQITVTINARDFQLVTL